MVINQLMQHVFGAGALCLGFYIKSVIFPRVISAWKIENNQINKILSNMQHQLSHLEEKGPSVMINGITFNISLITWHIKNQTDAEFEVTVDKSTLLKSTVSLVVIIRIEGNIINGENMKNEYKFTLKKMHHFKNSFN